MADETRKASRIPVITKYKVPGESVVKIDQGDVANSQLFLPATDDPSTYDEWGNLFNTLTFPQITASLREIKSFLDEWKSLGDAAILKSNSNEYSIINNNLKTVGVKVGYSNLTTIDTSKLFIHGFNKEGRPADTNGFLFLNDDLTETANADNPVNSTGTDGAIVKERNTITKTTLGPIGNSFVNQLTVLIIEGTAGVYAPRLISIPRDQINELDTTYNFNAWNKATDSLSSATSISTDLKYPSAPTNYGIWYDATTGSTYNPYKSDVTSTVSRTTTGWSAATRTTTAPAVVNNYSIKTRLTKDIYVLGICDTSLVSSKVVFNNFTMFPSPVSFLSFMLMFENDKAFLDFRVKDFKDKELLFKKTQDEIQNRIFDANKIKGEIDRTIRPFTLKKQNEAGTDLLVLEYFNNTSNSVVQSSFKNDVLDNAVAYPVDLSTRKRFFSATLLADDLDEVWYHGKSSAKLLRLGISGSTSATASEILSGFKIKGDLNVVNNTSLIGTLSVTGTTSLTGNVTLVGDLAINGGNLTSSATTFNFLTGTVTTANLLNSTTALSFGYNFTGSSTTNIVPGATASGSVKTINIGQNGVSGSTTNITIGSTNGTSINLIGSNTNTGTFTVTGATTLNSTLAVTGLVTLTNDLVVNGGDFLTTATTFCLLDTVATTINTFGGATTVNFGYDGTTTASTTNINGGALASGLTKTINFGANGLSGSITNINLGSGVTGALGTITANQAIIANKTLLVAGLTTLSDNLFINGGTLNTTSAVFSLLNQTATVIDAFGIAETLNLGNATTNNQIFNLSSGITSSGKTRVINLGKNGAAGSTTNIVIGSSLGSGTITLDQITQITKDLSVTGVTTLTGNLTVTGSAITFNGTTVHAGNTTTSGTTTLTGLLTANGGIATTSGTFSTTLSVTGATTLNSTLAVTGNTTLTGDLAINGGDLTSTNSTFNFLNTSVATFIGLAGATTVSLMPTTATSTLNLQTGATVSGSTKTINLGTAGLAGSITNITIGSSTGTTNINTYGTHTHTGAKTISSTLTVAGQINANGLLVANASVTLGDTAADALTVNATANFVAPVTIANLTNTVGTVGTLTVNTSFWSKGANTFDQLIHAKADINTDTNLVAVGEVRANKLKEKYLATGIEKYLGDIYQAKYEGSAGVSAINLPKNTTLWITKGATAYGSIGYIEPLNYVSGSLNTTTKIYSNTEYNFGISFSDDYLRFLNDSFINYPALSVGTKTDFTIYACFDDTVGQTAASTAYEFLSFSNASESLKIGFKTNANNDNLTLVIKRNNVELVDTVTTWPATAGAKTAGEIFRDKTIKNRSCSFNLYNNILSVIVGSEIVASYSFAAITNNLTTLKLGKTTGTSLKFSLKALTLGQFTASEWSTFTTEWIPNTTYNQIAQSSEGKFFFNRQPDYLEIKAGKVYVSGFNSNNVYSGNNTFNGSVTFAGSLVVSNGISSSLSVTGATSLASTLAVTGAVTLSSTLGVAGNVTITGDLAVNGGDLTSTSSTFNLLEANVATVNAFGPATLLDFGGTTVTSTTNIQTGSTLSGNTKTINIGTGGVSGSTTAILIGSATGTSSISLQGNTSNTGTLITTGLLTANSGISSSGFIIKNTSLTSKIGINLYGSFISEATNPSYGFMFTGTANSGTHGTVTGDWATYLTMDTNNQIGRGWIFREQQTSVNVASVDTVGNATFNKQVTAESFKTGSCEIKYNAATKSLDFNFA